MSERRLGGEREGDHRALAETAAELMRILTRAPGGIRHAHRGEQFDRARLRGRAAREPVDAQRLLDLKADRVDGVERDHRLLKDEADPAAADRAHVLLREVEQIVAIQLDAPAGDAARRHDQPDDGQGGDGLAAAGLAHQTERLARLNGQRHVVDGRGFAPVREPEHRAEVFDAEARDVRC